MWNWKINIFISIKGDFFNCKSFHLNIFRFFSSLQHTLSRVGFLIYCAPCLSKPLLRRNVLFCSLLARLRKHCHELVVLRSIYVYICVCIYICFLLNLYSFEHKICGFPNSDELFSNVCSDLSVCCFGIAVSAPNLPF